MTDFEKGAEAMREAAARECEAHYGPQYPARHAAVRSAASAIRALPLPAQPPGSERLKEGPNLWIGYCDLCNGQHCLQTLAATGADDIRRPPPPGSESREAEIDQAIEAERPKVVAQASQLAMRLREENTRLLGAMRSLACPGCSRGVWLEDRDGRKVLPLHRPPYEGHGADVARCPMVGKTVPDAFAASDKQPNRQPDARPEEKK